MKTINTSFMQVTIYKDFRSKQFNHVDIKVALKRIIDGKYLETITAIRNAETKDIADEIKKTLPCVCFSGKFGEKHTDESLIEHSGLIVLDFDHLDAEKKKAELCAWEYTYACWVSPSGKGVKVLVKIADPKEHRRHFDALKEHFPELDVSGRNEARLCFESFDPDLYVNESSKIWTKIVQHQTTSQIQVNEDDADVFKKLLNWTAKSGRAFRSGERNHFVFVLASACCRFGILEETAQGIISGYAIADSTFSSKECRQAVHSAYARNRNAFATAEFSNEKLVIKKTTKEVEIVLTPEDLQELSKQNVVFASDVSDEIMDIYDNGYQKVNGINVPEIDKHYKRKPGELTVITGFGNMGKSTYWYWYLMMRAIIFDEKVAVFSPESDPPSDFYWDLIETFMGCDCTPKNPDRPSRAAIDNAKQWIGEHFFDVSPKELSPTPELVKETFLSLVIAKGVASVIIDPFNQMSNDYNSAGGRTDKFLETFLADCIRFAKKNAVNFDIIAHPRTPRDKDSNGDYACPDQFSISDGSMWNNKADNIIVYHRPFGMSQPQSLDCEVHSKKIRRQKTVGMKGTVLLSYMRSRRRFLVGDYDPMQAAIEKMQTGTQSEITFTDPAKTLLQPNVSFLSSQDIKEAKEEHVPTQDELMDQNSPYYWDK